MTAGAAGGTGTDLAPLEEFGPYDVLSEIAHEQYTAGFSARAVRTCREALTLTRAAGDASTTRYLLYVEAVALLELGQYVEVLRVAEALSVELGALDLPVWRAKMLAVSAEANQRLDRPSAAIVSLAEADWLLRAIPTGSYGHLSASMAVALALRSANMVERSDEILSGLRGGGDAHLEMQIAQELALLSAHWATVLRLIGRTAESRRHFRATAVRAVRMGTWAAAAGDDAMRARAEVIEAYGAIHLEQAELGRARALDASRRFQNRPELLETHLLHLVLGWGLSSEGHLNEARGHLRAMVRDAEHCQRPLWAAAGLAALADVDTQQHGEAEGTRMWRQVARTALTSTWNEREARFAALRDQDSIRALRALASRYGEVILEDPLTGLGNRRMLARAVQSRDHQSVVFVDVDEFKSVNDTHSHAVGDAVLRAVADVLRAQSRAGDLLLRYGGDEFVVLPEGGADASTAVAQRIRSAVLAYPWGQIADGLAVTVSIGIGHAGADEDLLHSADRALMAAKRAGRNRVVEAGVAA